MNIFQFRAWCENAVSQIRFSGDKEQVFRELMGHMEDHYETLREQGIEEDAARQMVVEAMGDPWPVAKQLGQIHQPFWGYFLRATRILLVLALLALLIPAFQFLKNSPFSPPWTYLWDMYSTASYGSGTGRTLYHLGQPEESFQSGGYTFTATDAVLYRDDESGKNFFYCQVDQFHPLPWARHAEVGCWFWAEDDLGNYYYSYNEIAYEEVRKPCLYAGMSQTGILTHTYCFWINDLPQVSWLKLHYTRDGRDEMLFIDLTGGARQ